MWGTISNISAIVTCLTFLLYLSGRIWVVYKNRYTLYEEFDVIPYDSNVDIENEDNVLIVDSEGCEFTIKSNFGIETIKIYKLNYDSGMNRITSKDLVNHNSCCHCVVTVWGYRIQFGKLNITAHAQRRILLFYQSRITTLNIDGAVHCFYGVLLYSPAFLHRGILAS